MGYLLLTHQLRLKDFGKLSGIRNNQCAISITWKYLHGN